MGRAFPKTTVIAAAALAAGLACGEAYEAGTPFRYHVAAEYSDSAGAKLLDFETSLVCSEWGGEKCPAAGGNGALPASALAPDGCMCTGSYSLDFGPAGVPNLFDAFEFASSAAVPGGVASSENGVLNVTHRGVPCTGAVQITKAAAMASDKTGHSYPDVAAVFGLSCGEFELSKGLFYLIPKEFELGLER